MKVVAEYEIPAVSCRDPDKRGKSIALGMTVGSWSGISEDQKRRQMRFAGEYLGCRQVPTESGDKVRLRIGYPAGNFPLRIGELLVSVFGKLSMDGPIKLIDLEFPPDLLKQFAGPRFGIEGIRKELGIPGRPLLMSIFKCGFGLNPEEYSASLEEQFRGGADLVKDDEINFEESQRFERLKYCRDVIDRIYLKEKRKVLYAVNLSAPSGDLLRTARRLVKEGANALLINVLAFGWNVLQELSEDPEVRAVLVAHPALAGNYYPSPHHGMSSSLLLGRLMRIAGADLALFPSPYGTVSLPKEEAVEIARQLREEAPFAKTFPVPSAGIHPGLVPRVMEDFGNDVIINAGGGIHQHPSGTACGARAFMDAIEGLCGGENLEIVARRSPSLREALAAWT